MKDRLPSETILHLRWLRALSNVRYRIVGSGRVSLSAGMGGRRNPERSGKRRK